MAAAEMALGLWTQGGEAVGDAVGQGVQAAASTGEQVAALMSPDQVRALVREEVDRVVRRLGFAREDEMASLRREVGRLEQQVSALEATVALQATTKPASKGKPKVESKSKSKGSGKKHSAHEDGRS